MLQAAEATVVPVGRDQVEMALEDFRRFGKGRHPAGLDDGDLFAYGLAWLRAEPLSFVGADFARTDVTPAVDPTG